MMSVGNVAPLVGAMVRVNTVSAVALLSSISVAIACAPKQPALAPRVQAVACNSPLAPHLRVDLYTDRSNRNAPSGRLTDEEFKAFVEQVLVKHFPTGGTIMENSGWWRRPNGTTFHGLGRTFVVLIPEKEVQPERVAIRAVISEIKTRYGPRSVGWEEDWVCAAF